MLTIIGYSVSIANYKQVIDALSQCQRGNARKTPRMAHTRYTELLNALVSALAVLGFLCLAYFAVGVLERGSNEQAQANRVDRLGDAPGGLRRYGPNLEPAHGRRRWLLAGCQSEQQYGVGVCDGSLNAWEAALSAGS